MNYPETLTPEMRPFAAALFEAANNSHTAPALAATLLHERMDPVHTAFGESLALACKAARLAEEGNLREVETLIAQSQAAMQIVADGDPDGVAWDALHVVVEHQRQHALKTEILLIGGGGCTMTLGEELVVMLEQLDPSAAPFCALLVAEGALPIPADMRQPMLEILRHITPPDALAATPTAQAAFLMTLQSGAPADGGRGAVLQGWQLVCELGVIDEARTAVLFRFAVAHACQHYLSADPDCTSTLH